MNFIESLKLNSNSQISELNNIHNRKLFDHCIYVGSGDSYVAGLIAEYLTCHKCRCYSPSDLFNSNFIKDETYCFISVTGNTKANIALAKRATESGSTTIAITQNRNSKLAQVCREVIPLKLTTELPATAGFGSFVENTITCAQIVGVKIPSKFEIWHKRGLQSSLSLAKSIILPKSALYILGNNTLYALALYASLKMSEFFCTTVISNKLEEFCHSPVFGIKKSHHLWILGQKDIPISKRLEKLGFHTTYIELYRTDIFTQVFESIFLIQTLMLLTAKKYGFDQLQYLFRQDILTASSDIIYGSSNFDRQ